LLTISSNLGRWSCAGRRLALMSVRLVVAHTLWHYEFDFLPGDDSTDIISGTRNRTLVKPGPYHLSFRKRSGDVCK
jgi:hypothetical protein